MRHDVPEQLETTILPLLPLSTGAVLPHMVVTLTLESPEARAAVEAARSAEDTLLLVPKVGDKFARVGTVAHIEEMGRTPGGVEALVLRGLHRALIGSGVAGTGETTWVQIDPRPDSDEVTSRIAELAREYRGTIENIVDARGVPQVAEF